ncbi:MAG: hypothetical protein FRX48_07001 [Lasallia pustulata]|uniref:Uncharacterized protein n=1 Tax=Lasallia pustulata TaxID=136370 RepID=A0A5M8PKQ1_9LECA|nr:MAG: hypothetical protein FRX48_07001 [Lasallia pustulata]
MSSLARPASRLIPRLHAQRALLTLHHRLAFHPTGLRAALNETDRNRDDVAKEIDHHKDDQLRKQKEGKGHWKGELASNSESAVKADRGDMEATDDNIQKMQEETTKHHAEGREESK